MPRLLGTTALLLALALAAGGCDDACREGQTLCAGACRDAASFESDPDHCGACGVACGAGTCAAGACQCAAGAPPCAQANPRCCAAGATCADGACTCPAGPAAGCGETCCPGGAACCTDGLCPRPHANGLGQTYYDCGAPDEWTADQARLAGEAWRPTGTTWEAGQCSRCVCRQSTGEAAVWCYTGSNAQGLVLVTTPPTENCLAAPCPYPGNGVPWH